MTDDDLEGAVALQRLCFPPPFPEEFLWRLEHLARHREVYPEGQFVALAGTDLVGSASACLISEATWQAHCSWEETLGGWLFEGHDPSGSTLYGADISVHPNHRGRGVGRALYAARFALVRRRRLARFGTACRIPGYAAWSSVTGQSPEAYVAEVVAGRIADRTLTPLLRYGLRTVGVVRDYMEDEESHHAAALLEWNP